MKRKDPERYRTYEKCLAAVDLGFSLREIPYKHKTPEICLAAINQNPKAIKWSPYSILELMCLS